MVLRRDRGLVQATRTRRKTPVQEAHDASRTNRHGTGPLTRSHDWKLGTWNCRSLKFDGSIRILSDILRVRKFSIVALQEVGWIGAEEIQAYTRIGCTIYQSRGENRRLGTAFIVLGEMRDRVIGWTPLTDRMCVLRVKGRFFNISIINVHSPHSGSEDDDKDAFYEQLNWTYNSCPKHDVKDVIGNFNAQVGQEEEFRPVIGKFSAHVRTNENDLRLIDFATSKNMAVRSTCFQHNLRDKYTWRSPQGTESQIDHVVIDDSTKKSGIGHLATEIFRNLVGLDIQHPLSILTSFVTFVYRQQSYGDRLNPSLRMNWSNLSFQLLGACFKPYRDLFS
ncbi:craniofacial development protein 2-like [Culex pipiens pallens]|uniref:craniofacial development protein 2-like n=1 Tax=Culex pipiens pallens TaxID=42434 RepID=UPI001952F42B|nr:craniofacial development protein 2-like [Culex pipiens pallens]